MKRLMAIIFHLTENKPRMAYIRLAIFQKWQSLTIIDYIGLILTMR